ncbi:MAG TPA: alpha/beta hydrolase, partial [Methyloceanibacter sp.]|nr:alpha/beta hydrolase [Methyloceanibacter sp.]
MASLKRDGVSLFYEEAKGDKRPILLVHGWCCDHSFFAPQSKHFARQGHRVVAVDLRGHGQSDKPHEDYTMQLFADDLAFLCRELQLEKPVIIGHSMGGVVAFAFAARYPEIPSAIVTIDAGLHGARKLHRRIARSSLPQGARRLRRRRPFPSHRRCG